MNPFLKIGDVVYVASGGRNRYIVTSIKSDGFEAMKEGSSRISFHNWSDLKRWSNKKVEILYKELPNNSSKNNRSVSSSVKHK